VPQFRQNPSVKPGRPSLSRPTGWSQPLQKRLFSGTRGSASTALDGSRYGTGGISTRPAPSLPRDDRLVPRPRDRDREREPRLPAAEDEAPADPAEDEAPADPAEDEAPADPAEDEAPADPAEEE
jgi:hypothetical protein